MPAAKCVARGARRLSTPARRLWLRGSLAAVLHSRRWRPALRSLDAPRANILSTRPTCACKRAGSWACMRSCTVSLRGVVYTQYGASDSTTHLAA
eukprot:6189039-Pleurochrysis_carterae.AAC.1